MARQFCRAAAIRRPQHSTAILNRTPDMDFYTALRTADNHLRQHPLIVPAGENNPDAYRLACTENLAMALYERAKTLMEETSMDQDEANVQASGEVVELAKELAAPTAAHLADTAKQMEQTAAAAAEQDADFAGVEP